MGWRGEPSMATLCSVYLCGGSIHHSCVGLLGWIFRLADFTGGFPHHHFFVFRFFFFRVCFVLLWLRSHSEAIGFSTCAGLMVPSGHFQCQPFATDEVGRLGSWMGAWSHG